jgi:hypothetical protein
MKVKPNDANISKNIKNFPAIGAQRILTMGVSIYISPKRNVIIVSQKYLRTNCFGNAKLLCKRNERRNVLRGMPHWISVVQRLYQSVLSNEDLLEDKGKR